MYNEDNFQRNTDWKNPNILVNKLNDALLSTLDAICPIKVVVNCTF